MSPNKGNRTRRILFDDSDPISLIIRAKLRLNSGMATFIIIILFNLPILISAYINGIWFTVGNRAGLFQDYAWWLYQLTSFPVTIIFFLWLPDGVQTVFKGLKNNGVLIQNDLSHNEKDSLSRFIDEFEVVYSRRRWLLISIAAVVVFMAFVIQVQKQYTNWSTASQFLVWYTAFYFFFVFVIGLLGVLRLVLSMVWINRLFKAFQIDVKILHPDGAGGLSPLGEFSVKIGYVIGVLGISSVAGIISQIDYFDTVAKNIPFIFMIVSYVILAPIAFFAPIGSAHAAMKKAKMNFLLQVSEQFETDFAKIQSAMTGDPRTLKSKLEKVEQLQKIYSIASRFPIWPFNVDNLVRFFSSVLSPVLIILIPKIIEWIL